MKHVFIIHSHTLFLTAIGTIESLSLEDNKIIFLYARNYKNDIFTVPYKIIDISNLYRSFQVGNKLFWNRKFRKTKIKEVDSFIKLQICEKYIFYAPHYAFPLFQVFYTNVLCESGCYLQEGGIPFKKAYSIEFSILKKIYYFIMNYVIIRDGRVVLPNKWYIKGFLSKQKKVLAFSISKDFFRYLPAEIHIVSWPKIQQNLGFSSLYPFFIFDGYVNNHRIERDVYLNKCKDLIEKESKEMNYIKFHPVQDIKEREEILSFFPSGKSFQIINDGIPFEIILLSYGNIVVIGFDSSLLYFARDLGHTVRSYRDWLLVSTKFQEYISSL